MSKISNKESTRQFIEKFRRLRLENDKAICHSFGFDWNKVLNHGHPIVK